VIFVYFNSGCFSFMNGVSKLLRKRAERLVGVLCIDRSLQPSRYVNVTNTLPNFFNPIVCRTEINYNQLNFRIGWINWQKKKMIMVKHNYYPYYFVTCALTR
jgi:predicted transcriptional regulator YheO